MWQAKELGATASIDASLGDTHVRDEVARLTDGVGADITVDAAGFVSTVENAVSAYLCINPPHESGLMLRGNNACVGVVHATCWEDG